MVWIDAVLENVHEDSSVSVIQDTVRVYRDENQGAILKICSGHKQVQPALPTQLQARSEVFLGAQIGITSKWNEYLRMISRTIWPSGDVVPWSVCDAVVDTKPPKI